MWRVTILFLLTLISACQSAYINGVPNERSPLFQIPVDSRFILNRALTVQPGKDSVYFQRGQILPWYDVNEYGSYCYLIVDRQRNAKQFIKPGEFLVHTVSRENFYYIGRAGDPDTLSLDFRKVSGEMNGGGNGTYEVLGTVMDLRSDTQPDVRRMTCAEWSTPQSLWPITVEEIRQTLGEFFTLELAI